MKLNEFFGNGHKGTVLKKIASIIPIQRKKDRSDLTITQRIERILSDEEFKVHCEDLAKQHPNLHKEMEYYEKIARIDISGIDICPQRNENVFSKHEMEDAILSFFLTLDKSYVTDPLLNRAIEKISEFEISTIEGDKTRSHVSWTTDKKHGLQSKTFINGFSAGIAALAVGIHEATHALIPRNDAQVQHKDSRMVELCATTLENISHGFLCERHPMLKPRLERDKDYHTIQNVARAREVLVQGAVVRVVTGQMSLDKARELYGDVISQDLLKTTLSDIETYRFEDMHEARYLYPQAFSHAFDSLYQREPSTAVKMIKSCMESETLVDFDYVSELVFSKKAEELTEDYVQYLEKEVENIRERVSHANQTTEVEKAEEEIDGDEYDYESDNDENLAGNEDSDSYTMQA